MLACGHWTHPLLLVDGAEQDASLRAHAALSCYRGHRLRRLKHGDDAVRGGIAERTWSGRLRCPSPNWTECVQVLVEEATIGGIRERSGMPHDVSTDTMTVCVCVCVTCSTLGISTVVSRHHLSLRWRSIPHRKFLAWYPPELRGNDSRRSLAIMTIGMPWMEGSRTDRRTLLMPVV